MLLSEEEAESKSGTSEESAETMMLEWKAITKNFKI